MSTLPAEDKLDPDLDSQVPTGEEFAAILDQPCAYGEDEAPCPKLDEMDSRAARSLTEPEELPEKDELPDEEAELADTFEREAEEEAEETEKPEAEDDSETEKESD